MIKTGMLLLAGLSRVHPEFFFHVISRVQQLHWELALKAHSAVVEGVSTILFVESATQVVLAGQHGCLASSQR